ncbi:hypothetical protein D5086_010011 [Populus alba]|uniref:Uncharacterized protein n=1 Tax=Populus alba TaxID=43335 RepID=A0ACC4C8S5_POPAL
MKLDSLVATDIVSFHALVTNRSTPFIGKSVIFYKSRALAFTVAENVKKYSIEVPSGDRRSCSIPQAQNIERIFATTWFI